MAEYGSCITFTKSCSYDKERIKHALKGELLCGEDENGFIYASASKEECDKYILQAYDNVVYHAKQAMDSGRALDRLIADENIEIDFHKYIKYMCEEQEKFNDYDYEPIWEDE